MVVGQVLEKSQHPEADRLSVCSVEVGAENPAQIVCGATNFKAGDRVPVALPEPSYRVGLRSRNQNFGE